MAHQEFLRQLPQSGRNKKNIWLSLHIDLPLLIALLCACSYGLFILYSASNQDLHKVTRQVMHLGAALMAMLITAQIPPRSYKFWAPWFFGIGLLLLVIVLIAGADAKGAQRWIRIPGVFRFQPSEIMKVVMPITMAWYLSERTIPPSLKHIIISLLIIIIPTLLIARQPDLGTSLLIACSGGFVLFMSGLSWYLISFILLAGVIGAPFMYHFVLHAYQQRRVDTFLNPESDPLGAGWNIIQSKTAIGSGGLSGKGWLQGTQSQLDFLPEGSTDFIIAVAAEELGFIGVCILLLIYLAIIARGLFIGWHAQDSFSRLLAGGITLTFFVYVFVNIGMVSGLLPVVGVPLPLVSYGGTSIVTLMAGFGILMSIHTHKRLLST